MARRPTVTRADIATAVKALMTVARAQLRQRYYLEAARYYRVAARLARWSGDSLGAVGSDRKADEAERLAATKPDNGDAK